MEALGVGLFVLLIVAIFAVTIGGLVFWIIALIELVKIPEYQYQAAGTEKVVWVLVVVLTGWIGALVWWFVKRKDVLAAEGRIPPPGPGWYPDPASTGGLRWWDGRAWTDHRPPA